MASIGRQVYKLYVRNIPWTIGSNELKTHFAKYGQINAANVIFDKNTGLSKNYGFVHFASKDSYDSAIAANHTLEGNVLKVESGSN